MTDIFQEIRRIEGEAENLISSAENKKIEIIKETKRAAEESSKKEAEKLDAYLEEENKKANKEAETAKHKVLSENHKLVSKLKHNVSNNTDKAVQHVLKQFEGLFE